MTFHLSVWTRCILIWFISKPNNISNVLPVTIKRSISLFPHISFLPLMHIFYFVVFSAHFFAPSYPAFLPLLLSPPVNRSRLTWKTQPSTTSSAPSSSRWSGTWESLALRRWACPAPTSPLTTGACRQGRATAPPTALWPYWPWTLTARKRWGFQEVRLFVHKLFTIFHNDTLFVNVDTLHHTHACLLLYMSCCFRWMMSLMTLLVWSPVTVMISLAWWTQDFRWPTRYVRLCHPQRWACIQTKHTTSQCEAVCCGVETSIILKKKHNSMLRFTLVS